MQRNITRRDVIGWSLVKILNLHPPYVTVERHLDLNSYHCAGKSSNMATPLNLQKLNVRAAKIRGILVLYIF